MTGSACLGQETPATVTLHGTDVRIEVKTGGTDAVFAGKVSGKNMSGSMTVTCGGRTGMGSWLAASS